MAKRQGLTYPKEMYQPRLSFMKANFTDAEIRAEYTRLRDIAEKRLKRIEQSEFKEGETYKFYAKRFKPLKEITSGKEVNAELVKSLSELSQFIEKKTSTISGLKAQKRKAINTLAAHGINIDPDSFIDFAEFMRDAKEFIGSRYYDSDQALDVWNFGRKEGLSTGQIMRHFDVWYENHDKLSMIAKTDDKKHNSTYYLNRLKELK